jgi:hydrogenase expression/formation protein HypE
MAMEHERITLAHGNGGRFMRELIEELFARHLNDGQLDTRTDAAHLNLSGDLLFTTDGFTVKPLEFPGGSIGSLAVHGTINDLAVAGAIPKVLSLNAFIEEGLEFAQLDRIVADLARAARECSVQVVAGDTKVLPHGEGSGLYLATSGIGVRATPGVLSLGNIRPGDALVINGSVGDHGTAVLLAREQFGLRGDLQSDAASVLPYAQALFDLPGLRFMRDPTRGGLATVAHEIADACGLTVRLSETTIPVKDPVRGVCEMLGYDPYYLACEGRVIAIVAQDAVDDVLARWRGIEGSEAALIGRVEEGDSRVILETTFGGERYLEELEDDPLPRIC